MRCDDTDLVYVGHRTTRPSCFNSMALSNCNGEKTVVCGHGSSFNAYSVPVCGNLFIIIFNYFCQHYRIEFYFGF